MTRPGGLEAGIPAHTRLHHRSLELFNSEPCVTGKDLSQLDGDLS